LSKDNAALSDPGGFLAKYGISRAFDGQAASVRDAEKLLKVSVKDSVPPV